MKHILKYIIRGFAILGFMVFVTSAVGWGVLLTHGTPKMPESVVLSIDFTKEIPEHVDVNPIKTALGKTGDVTLKDAVSAIDLAANDPRVKAMVGRFGENPVSMAGAQELRDAVYRLRDARKQSYAYAASFGEFGAADKAYYLASSFEQIWLQPLGLVGITGLAAQSPFVHDALEKIGLKADFLHREEYKSAMDMLTENNFTTANAEMLGSILDDLNMQMVDDIAAERGLQPLSLMRLIDTAPLDAQTALREHLVTHIGYTDELDDQLHQTYDAKTEVMDIHDYLMLRRHELSTIYEDQKEKPVIAYIHATGAITQSASGPAKSDGIAADETVDAIYDAMDDNQVEAILLRIDSPGGSAVASETIRRAIETAQRNGLPVIVSMGEVAASGGYWIAAQADAIIADPATLTGSIGVIAGKITGTEALWNKLGVNWGMIKRGENADLWTVTTPFTDVQRAKVDDLVGQTYDAFKRHVAYSRDLSENEVAALAKGRVWTANQALNLGLVDELGGFADAINYTKSLLGVDEDTIVMLKPFPAPEPLAVRLIKMAEVFGGMDASVMQMQNLIKAMHIWLAPAFSIINAGQGQVIGQAVMKDVGALR